MKLKADGWREIEVLETYEGEYAVPASGFSGISKILAADDANTIEKIAALAKDNFIHDRHHTDPEVSKEAADNFKAEWVRNACRQGGKRHCFYTTNARDEVEGFLICTKVGRKLVIDLIAVKQEVRQWGIAGMLINDASARTLSEEIRAGTQSTNTAAKRLYESLGMSIVQRERTFHK